MIRYWFEFEGNNLPSGIVIGCGVTADTYPDAISILKSKVFTTTEIPTIKNCTENIDVSSLDKDHVLLNMLPPNQRGIWFPLGY